MVGRTRTQSYGEPSEAAGAELLATERAKAAEREATERAKEEKHREKMAAMRKEQCRPQTEANEKYRREHPEDPTIGNRIPIQGYPLDPAAAVAWSVSYEGNKFWFLIEYLRRGGPSRRMVKNPGSPLANSMSALASAPLRSAWPRAAASQSVSAAFATAAESPGGEAAI
jgi:hypothetical protein